MLAVRGWIAGGLLVVLWAATVLVCVSQTGLLSGFGVITKNVIFYGSLIAPCVMSAFITVQGRTPVAFWEGLADALFWGGILVYPVVFLGVLAWRNVF